jgi:hypothetical protein
MSMTIIAKTTSSVSMAFRTTVLLAGILACDSRVSIGDLGGLVSLADGGADDSSAGASGSGGTGATTTSAGGSAGAVGGTGGSAGSGEGGMPPDAGIAVDADPGTPPRVSICGPGTYDSTFTCEYCEYINCHHDATGCASGECSDNSMPACEDYATLSDQQLCSAVLTCARQTNCAAGGPTSCYCGQADLFSCLSGLGNGACRTAIEAGLKTTDPGFILKNVTKQSLPAGGALARVQCDHFACGTPATAPYNNKECVPFCKPLGALSADAGQVSAGGPDGGETSDAAPVESCQIPRANPATCEECEARNCPHDAAGCAEGACRAQPACSDYSTARDRDLCTSALNCIRSTGCIRSGVEFCYCGLYGDFTDCRQGVSGGVCKREIEDALKSTDPAFIMDHLTDPSLPGGGALSLGVCDAIRCSDLAHNECLPYCY